ncbi:MAG: fumarate reductase subunit C, partial [Ramlibacter sp.]|nr:fumarate reductase subunit C [Ramlibacter sp.]
MNGKAAVRRPYVRPMQGWWRRDPFFMAYMLREATALGVLVYSIVLCVGVVRLSQGEAAWNGFLAALKSPGSILLHLVLLLCFAVHARSWFEIMPKTMPMMHLGG